MCDQITTPFVVSFLASRCLGAGPRRVSCRVGTIPTTINTKYALLFKLCVTTHKAYNGCTGCTPVQMLLPALTRHSECFKILCCQLNLNHIDIYVILEWNKYVSKMFSAKCSTKFYINPHSGQCECFPSRLRHSSSLVKYSHLGQ